MLKSCAFVFAQIASWFHPHPRPPKFPDGPLLEELTKGIVDGPEASPFVREIVRLAEQDRRHSVHYRHN
jgi:hypothetical protein